MTARALATVVVVKEFPWPTRTGGHNRAAGILSLCGTANMTTIAAPPNRWGEDQQRPYGTTALRVDRPKLSLVVTRLVLTGSLRSARFLDIRGFSEAFWLALEATDFVILDELASASIPLIERAHALGKPVVYSAHNVESAIRYPYPGVPRPLRRSLWRRDVRVLEQCEATVAAAVDGLIAVSSADAERFAAWTSAPLLVIPNCIDRPPVLPAWSGRSGVVIAGSFGWGPNREGLQWFLSHVAPSLVHRLPVTVVSNHLHRADTRSMGRLGVSYLEDVNDIGAVLLQHRVSVVPVWSGGGSRVRIPESLAHGLHVVSTSKGAEGQPASVLQSVHVLDDSEAMLNTIVELHGSAEPAAACLPTWAEFAGPMQRFIESLQ